MKLTKDILEKKQRGFTNNIISYMIENNPDNRVYFGEDIEQIVNVFFKKSGIKSSKIILTSTPRENEGFFYNIWKRRF